MTLNAQRIISAAQAITSLTTTTFAYRYARQISRLKRWLDEECTSISNAQIALVEKYHGVVHADGSITFDAPDDQKSFIAETSRQFQESIDYDVPVCDLRGGCNNDDLRISAVALEALDGMIIFD